MRPIPHASVATRFYDLLADVADELRLRGEDPAVELAGRFGLRRYAARRGQDDGEPAGSPWLERTARLRKAAREVARALGNAGVPHFFFKGIALVGRYYRLDERFLADIDLVVDPADRLRALAELHALGYAEIGTEGPSSLRPGVTMARTDPQTGEEVREALLDLHWGIEPVTAILPDEAVSIPRAVWISLEQQRGLPVPSDELHAALVLHHLVRHDLQHVRGLLDLALLWSGLPKNAGGEMADLANQLGVGRALGLVGRVLVDDLHLYPLRGLRLGPSDFRGRLAVRRLALRKWLARAAWHSRDPTDHLTVTLGRSWRRFLVADRASGTTLVRELLSPPRPYLEWRWPNATNDGAAWRSHVQGVLRPSTVGQIHRPGRRT